MERREERVDDADKHHYLVRRGEQGSAGHSRQDSKDRGILGPTGHAIPLYHPPLGPTLGHCNAAAVGWWLAGAQLQCCI